MARGRPAIGEDRTVTKVRLGDLRADVQAWAREHGGLTVNEAVRRLIARGLTVPPDDE